MNQIIRKMRELVDAIERASLSDEQQRTWAVWWGRHLRMAIEKARKAGWIDGGGSNGS